MQKIAIAGLAAAAVMLGGAAVPTVAMAQPAARSVTAAAASSTSVRPMTAMAARAAEAARIAEAARNTRAVRLPGLDGLAATPADDEAADGAPLISCVFTVDCIAVEGSDTLTGSASDGSESGAVATDPHVHVARWNGSSWTVLGVALPTGTKEAGLDGVSCKGARSCLIVGDYYTSASETAAEHALALESNGTAVKPTPALPLPKGTVDAALSDVSCATVWYCVAVGQAQGSSPAFGANGAVTLIETWNGGKWTLHTVSQGGATSDSEVTGVSCATSSFCVLTGETVSIGGTSSDPTITAGMYFARWNGARLTTMKPAAAASPGGLTTPIGVSCASADNCGVTGVAVVGTSASTATLDSFTEIWNGASWQLATTAWPSGVTEELTIGISCYAAHSCEAVGASSTAPASATDPSADVAAVSYTGATGVVQTLPAPAAGYSDEFTDVGCMPWGTCVAVGYAGQDTATTPATMTGTWGWNQWRLHAGF